MASHLIAVLVFALLGDSAAQPANLSGTWHLNLERSDFGNEPPPREIEVRVTHNEPAIRYTGRVVDSMGAASPIDFESVLDGKPHRMSGSAGGTLTSKRLDSRSISTEWQSADGKFRETSVVTIQEDGRSITIKRHTTGPGQSGDVLEVYEK